MKKLTVLIALVFASLLVYGQPVFKDYDDLLFEQALRATSINANKFSNIKGSPYQTNNFSEGKVTLKGDTSFILPLRYNVYQNTFEYKHGDQIFGIANVENIKEILLNNSKYIYFTDRVDEKHSSYYQLHADGKCILLSKKRIVYKEAQQGDGIRPTTPSEFIKQKDQYFIINNASELELLSSKKILLKTLSDKSDEIKAFMKENRLSVKKIEDLTKIIDFYNKTNS